MKLSTKAVIAGLLAAAALAATYVFRQEILAGFERVSVWIEALGPWGSAIYAVVLVAAVVVFLPTGPLYLAAGAIFGLTWGTVYAFLANTLAGACAFLIARHVARRRVEKRLRRYDKLRAIDLAVKDGGFLILCLVHASPILPTSVINYGLGLTGVRFRDYFLASIGTLPGIFFTVYFGAVLGDVARLFGGHDVVAKGPVYYVMLTAGVVVTLLATAWITRRTRNILDATTSDPLPEGELA